MDVELDFIRNFFDFVAADAIMPKHRAINEAHSVYNIYRKYLTKC